MEVTLKLLAEAVGPSRPPAAVPGPQCMDCESAPAVAAAVATQQQAPSAARQDAQQAAAAPASSAAAAATNPAADPQQAPLVDAPATAAPAVPPAPPLSPAAAAFASHLQTLFERPIREEEVQGPAAAAGPTPPDCPPDCPAPPTENAPSPGVDLLTVDLTKPQRARRGPSGSSSRFRGVTRHRRTRRWEAHIWDVKKQVYLGGFDDEHSAAKAHDLMALKCRGPGTLVNFDVTIYAALTPLLDTIGKEELVHLLRNESKRKPRPPSAAAQRRAAAAAAGGAAPRSARKRGRAPRRRGGRGARGGAGDTTSESDIDLDDVTTDDDVGDAGDAGDAPPRPAPARKHVTRKRTAAAGRQAATPAAAGGCSEPPLVGTAAAAAVAAAAAPAQQQGASEPAVRKGSGAKVGPSAAGPASPPPLRRRAAAKQQPQKQPAAGTIAALGESLIPQSLLLPGPGAAPLSDEPRPLSALLEHPMPPDVLAAILGGPISAIDRTLLTERLAATAAIAREGFGSFGLDATAAAAAAEAMPVQRTHGGGGGAAAAAAGFGAPAWAAGGSCVGGGSGPAWSCGSGSSPTSPLVSPSARIEGGGGLPPTTSLPLPPTPVGRAQYAQLQHATAALSAPQAQLQHAWAAHLQGCTAPPSHGELMGSSGGRGPGPLNTWSSGGNGCGPAGPASAGGNAGQGRYLSGPLSPQQQQQQQQQQQRVAGGAMPYAALQQHHNHQTHYQQQQQCRYPVITSPPPTPRQPRGNSGNGGTGYGARPAPSASPQGCTLQGAASLVTSCSPQEQWELLRRSQQTLADRDSVSGAPLLGQNCHRDGGPAAAPPAGAFSTGLAQPPPALWHQPSAPCWASSHQQQAASAVAAARPATAPPAPVSAQQRGVGGCSAAASADSRGRQQLAPPPAAPTPSQVQPVSAGAALAATASGSADSVAHAGQPPQMQPPTRPIATRRAPMISPFLTAQQDCTPPPAPAAAIASTEQQLQQLQQLQQPAAPADRTPGRAGSGGQLLIGAAALGLASGSFARSGSLSDVFAAADRMLDAASGPATAGAAAAAAKDAVTPATSAGGKDSMTDVAARGGGSSSEPPTHQHTAHSGIPSPTRVYASAAAPSAATGVGLAPADASADNPPPAPPAQQQQRRRVAWADCYPCGGMGGGDGEESGTDEGWCPELYGWPPAGYD